MTRGPKDSYKFWEHLIGAENERSEKLTTKQLSDWSNNLNRQLECVFCQIVEKPTHFILRGFLYCPRCGEYKGIQPYIPGWSNFEE